MAASAGSGAQRSSKSKAIRSAESKQPKKRFGAQQIIAIITGFLYGYAFTPAGPTADGPEGIGLIAGGWSLIIVTLITAGIMFTSSEEDGPPIWCASVGGGLMILLHIALTKNVPWNFWFTMLLWIVMGMAGMMSGLLMLGGGV